MAISCFQFKSKYSKKNTPNKPAKILPQTIVVINSGICFKLTISQIYLKILTSTLMRLIQIFLSTRYKKNQFLTLYIDTV